MEAACFTFQNLWDRNFVEWEGQLHIVAGKITIFLRSLNTCACQCVDWKRKELIKKQAVENQNCHDVILKYSWSVLKKDLVILFQFNRCCHYARFGSAEVLDLLNYQLTSHSWSFDSDRILVSSWVTLWTWDIHAHSVITNWLWLL